MRQHNGASLFGLGCGLPAEGLEQSPVSPRLLRVVNCGDEGLHTYEDQASVRYAAVSRPGL